MPPGDDRPDDSFAEDLIALTFWDGLDWMGLVLGVEEELSRRVIIAEEFIGRAPEEPGDRGANLRVKHVVRELSLSASPEEQGAGSGVES